MFLNIVRHGKTLAAVFTSRSVAVLFLSLGATALAAQEADGTAQEAAYQSARQGVQLGLSQQRQLFTFEDRELTTDIISRTLQYQYSQGSWVVGASYAYSEAEKSATDSAVFQFEFDSQSFSVFAEKSFADLWLGLALSQGDDNSRYQAGRVRVNADIRDDTDFRNLTADIGYGQFLSSSYWSASTSLTQQWLTTQKRLALRRASQADILQDSDGNEQALLAGFNARYEHYFPLNEHYELAVSGGLNHQFTLSGDGLIQLNNQRHGRGGVQQQQRTETLTHSASASTALSLRLSLLHLKYSLSAEIDQLTDQSSTDAYYGAGIGISF